jgi:hypothetical protein
MGAVVVAVVVLQQQLEEAELAAGRLEEVELAE